MNQWSRKDAEAHIKDVFDAARHAPQIVAADGHNFVVVEQSEFERMGGTSGRKKSMKDGKEMTFIDHLLSIPKGGPDDLFERQQPTPREIDF